METLSSVSICQHLRIHLSSRHPTEFIDVTDRLQSFITHGGVRVGDINVQTLHTTTGTVINEGAEFPATKHFPPTFTFSDEFYQAKEFSRSSSRVLLRLDTAKMPANAELHAKEGDFALAWAKTLGVTYMTFKDVHIPRTDPPEATRALRAKIEAAGITIMGGGTITIPNNPVQIKKEFEYAKNAGFPLIYTDPDPAALDTIEQMAKEYDIKVAIHNHGPENKNWPRPQDAYAAVKSRDNGLRAAIDLEQQTLRLFGEPRDPIDGALLDAVDEEADVGAGDEGSARTRNHNSPHVRIRGGATERLGQLRDDGFVQRVHRIGTVDGDRGDAV